MCHQPELNCSRRTARHFARYNLDLIHLLTNTVSTTDAYVKRCLLDMEYTIMKLTVQKKDIICIFFHSIEETATNTFFNQLDSEQESYSFTSVLTIIIIISVINHFRLFLC